MNVSARIGVDTGGTFTDVVVLQPDGSVSVRKLSSTPDDPSQSVLNGLTECLTAGEMDSLSGVVHGTTVATNALLQRRGVPTALITTRGFRDLLSIGRQTRPQLYALHPRKPIPLLARTDCYEVEERMDWQGRILTPLDLAAVARLLAHLKERGIDSLAICFLFSYLNPVHERALGCLAQEQGFHVSLSCEIAPESREYERAGTTVANAFVAPLMARYLTNLQFELRKLTTPPLRIMQSNGGALSAEEAAQQAITTALSGPAGGVVAATHVGTQAGFPDLLTFDMGGTSTDVALIVEGQCPVVTSGMLGDLPLRTPQLAIHTVGAGGGSLVRVDQAGGLRVGPQSAGADPGPVAYGRGDTLTVTDANVLLGRLPADIRLAGRLPLDADRVRAHFDVLAHELGVTPEAAALGILAVANATMARALRHVSVERGHDPARFTLLAFGGAGALHACALAQALEIHTILIPRYPGAFSALGLALADAHREYVQAVPPTRLPTPLHFAATLNQKTETSVKTPVEKERVEKEEEKIEKEKEDNLLEITSALLNALLEELRTRSDADRLREGFSQAAWKENAVLDLRYVGQSFELRVSLPILNSPILSSPISGSSALNSAISVSSDLVSNSSYISSFISSRTLLQAVESFHALHKQRFGYADSRQPVEVTAVRLVAVGKEPLLQEARPTRNQEPASLLNLHEETKSSTLESEGEIQETEAAVKAIKIQEIDAENRSMYEEGRWHSVPVYKRTQFVSGHSFSGPALVLQEDATTYISSGWQATVDHSLNIVLYDKNLYPKPIFNSVMGYS